MSVKLHLIT